MDIVTIIHLLYYTYNCINTWSSVSNDIAKHLILFCKNVVLVYYSFYTVKELERLIMYRKPI